MFKINEEVVDSIKSINLTNGQEGKFLVAKAPKQRNMMSKERLQSLWTLWLGFGIKQTWVFCWAHIQRHNNMKFAAQVDLLHVAIYLSHANFPSTWHVLPTFTVWGCRLYLEVGTTMLHKDLQYTQYIGTYLTYGSHMLFIFNFNLWLM